MQKASPSMPSHIIDTRTEAETGFMDPMMFAAYLNFAEHQKERKKVTTQKIYHRQARNPWYQFQTKGFFLLPIKSIMLDCINNKNINRLTYGQKADIIHS